MRTTITLDAEARALVEREMRERQRSFKDVVNDAIKAGLGARARASAVVELPVHDLGVPLVDLDKALQLAGELEDEEILRELALGK